MAIRRASRSKKSAAPKSSARRKRIKRALGVALVARKVGANARRKRIKRAIGAALVARKIRSARAGAR